MGDGEKKTAEYRTRNLECRKKEGVIPTLSFDIPCSIFSFLYSLFLHRLGFVHGPLECISRTCNNGVTDTEG